MTNTKELQKMIAEWSRETFGGGPTPIPNTEKERRWGMMAHFSKEFDELLGALKTNDPKRIGNELADCAMLLFDMADISGIDIGAAMLEKLEINKKRKWGKPDEHGCIEHIEE